MALPYVTESQARKIAKQEIKNGGSQPSPEPTPTPTPLDNPPLLGYTYDELKQYKDVQVEEIPEEIVRDIQSYIDLFSSEHNASYVELATKDGHVFKGCILLVEDAPVSSSLNCINYNSESGSTEWLSLVFTATDAMTEAGGFFAKFTGIEYNVVR